MEPILPDILAPGLKVIFVGAAPSHWSAKVGHYYAGPSNRFWLLLHQSGFTSRQLRPEEDVQVLGHGIGLTGLFKHTSSSANHLLPPPSHELRHELMVKLLACSPQFVCFNGKDVYRLVTGRACLDWGEQDERIGASRVFVAISSSARADAWGSERLTLFRELFQLTGLV